MTVKSFSNMLYSLSNYIYNYDTKDNKSLNIINNNIKAIISDNEIKQLFKKRVSDSIKNKAVHDISFNIGAILGIIDGDLEVLDLFPKSINFIDENNIPTTFEIKNLRKCLEQINDSILFYYSNICVRSTNFDKVEKASNVIDSISSFKKLLILTNGMKIVYCKLFGYIDCTLYLYSSFIANYHKYNFDDTNELIRKISFYIGLSIGYMYSNDLKEKMLVSDLLSLQNILIYLSQIH